MATFVLVHGAWQGGWVYARLATRLRAFGHVVYTPSLTGLGERSHLSDQAITLDTHIQDIVNVLKFEDLKEVILCGHSYGGMVITGVVGEVGERIRSMFYLDAYVPNSGQSLADIAGADVALAFLDQARVCNGLIPPISSAMFNVNERDADWVDAICVPQALATFMQGVRVGVEAISMQKRTFVYASENGGDWFLSTYERLKNDPQWKVHVVSCGHAVMLDRTDELVDLLLAETGGA